MEQRRERKPGLNVPIPLHRQPRALTESTSPPTARGVVRPHRRRLVPAEHVDGHPAAARVVIVHVARGAAGALLSEAALAVHANLANPVVGKQAFVLCTTTEAGASAHVWFVRNPRKKKCSQ